MSRHAGERWSGLLELQGLASALKVNFIVFTTQPRRGSTTGWLTAHYVHHNPSFRINGPLHSELGGGWCAGDTRRGPALMTMPGCRRCCTMPGCCPAEPCGLHTPLKRRGCTLDKKLFSSVHALLSTCACPAAIKAYPLAVCMRAAAAGGLRPWFVPLVLGKDLSKTAAAGQLTSPSSNGASGSGSAGGISGSEAVVRRVLEEMRQRAALSRTDPSHRAKRQRQA